MKHDICQHIVKGFFALVVLSVCLFFPTAASAERFESDNWTIDASVIGNAFGGATESDNYRMETTGGEAIIGRGEGGSYKLGQGYVAQLEQAIQISIQPSGLAAYYPMDENTGTRVHDDSTNENSSAGQTTATWTPGKIGSGLAFDGDDVVSIPNDSSLNLASDIALMAWVRPGVAAQPNTAIVSKDSDDTNYWLGLSGSNEAEFNVDCPGSTSATSTTAITDTSNWYHVAGIKEGTELKIFVNGQLEDTATCGSTGSNTNSSPLLIGNDAGNNHFNGAIDEVKLFNRAFFDQELENEFIATNSGVPSALTFPNLLPDSSEIVNADVVVQTDAPGYLLGIMQNGDMTNGTSTIPAIGGSIGSPTPWTEGTTTGLGFTLSGGNVNIPGTWGSSPDYNYAPLPNSTTTFYTRSGFTGGAKDILEMQYRVGVDMGTPAGEYSNTATYTGTLLP